VQDEISLIILLKYKTKLTALQWRRLLFGIMNVQGSYFGTIICYPGWCFHRLLCLIRQSSGMYLCVASYSFQNLSSSL